MNKFFGFNTTRTPSLNSVKNSHFGDTRFIIGRGNNFSISSKYIQRKYFSSSTHSYYSDNEYNLKGFYISQTRKFFNFFELIKGNKDRNIVDSIHNPWIDGYTNKYNDLYNYFYTKFFRDYHLFIESDEILANSVNFNKIYIVYYKSCPMANMWLNIWGSNEWCGFKDNILYYETFYVQDINKLRDKFINAYKNNKYKDLDICISILCNCIIENLIENILSDENYSNLKHLHLNFIIPHNKDKYFSSIKENNSLIHTNNIGKRFYSTYIHNSIYSVNRNCLQYSTNNPLILCSDITTKYRLNKRLITGYHYKNTLTNDVNKKYSSDLGVHSLFR